MRSTGESCSGGLMYESKSFITRYLRAPVNSAGPSSAGASVASPECRLVDMAAARQFRRGNFDFWTPNRFFLSSPPQLNFEKEMVVSGQEKRPMLACESCAWKSNDGPQSALSPAPRSR